MRLREVIELIAQECREENKLLYSLKDERNDVYVKLAKIDLTGGSEISLKDYNALLEQRESLRKRIAHRESYLQGMEYTKSILCTIGADKIIDEQ